MKRPLILTADISVLLVLPNRNSTKVFTKTIVTFENTSVYDWMASLCLGVPVYYLIGGGACTVTETVPFKK